MAPKMKKLGDVLISTGLITTEQLDEALEKQKQSHMRLGEILIQLGYITDIQLCKALEYMLRIPYVELPTYPIDADAVLSIPEEVASRYALLPIQKEEDTLIVAMSDPLDYNAEEELRRITGMKIHLCIATKAEITSAIDRFFGTAGAKKAVEEMKTESVFTELSGLEEMLDNEVSNAPVVRLVNSLLDRAIKSRASDIHIEPMDDEMLVRFRIDGQLQEIIRTPITAHSAIVTRIKIIGDMDIAEKRLPQDGRVEVTVNGQPIDLRLSVLPTVHGEKIVIRILGQMGMEMRKADLGFTPENLALFDKIFQSPNGMILVSGPTGSGKSTTLYTVLKELNDPTRNVITVEDPVEYKLKGINQVQVNPKAGLTFANGLRSILRQDPDVIMIGEIRDAETAEIAIRASITGHLVLSTIHTNDAASSVSRLMDMGVAPYLVSSSLVGVIAQRLVRKICPYCKTAYRPNHAELMQLKLREPRDLWHGTGCPRCNQTGYLGRTAIHEILVVTKEIRELIDHNASIDQLRQMSIRNGTMSLRESCIKLVMDGVTTAEELMKITYSVDG